MWKFVFIAIAAYFLYRLFANDLLKKSRQEEIEERCDREEKLAAGKMAKDPECGQWIDKNGAPAVRDGDKVSYFCSYDCRDKFLKKLEADGTDGCGRDDQER